MRGARRTPPAVTGLYAPQFEQFGIELAGEGAVFTGKVATEDAEGSAWVMPLGASCLVMEHSVVPRHDMSLMERAPEPYACVTQVSSAAVDCMPEAGISPANVRPLRGPWPASAVCTFVQSNCEEQFSPLRSGQLYHSRCIAFLPEYFEELDGRWPGGFGELFEAFARPWAEDAQMAIGGALRRLTATRVRGHAGELYATGVVEALVADLAAAWAEGQLAAERAGGGTARLLAEEAAAEVERALDEGRRPGVDELAARLYVSRSKLCATFRQETGEAVGTYVRRRRGERAEELLADAGLEVGEVARRLGYPSAGAFCQAFRTSHGVSPSDWRAAR